MKIRLPPPVYEIVQLTFLQTVGHVGEVGNASVQFWKEVAYIIILSENCTDTQYGEKRQLLHGYVLLCKEFNIYGMATKIYLPDTPLQWRE